MKLNLLICFAFLIMTLSSCYISRAYHYRKFELKDVEKMAATKLPKAATPFKFISGDTQRYATLRTYLDSQLANTRSYAFLVIRNDTILYENYYNKLNSESKLPSFSVAKSFVSTLVAIALEEGKIKSLQEPVTTYLPELGKTDPRFKLVTIQHVLDMRSGIKSNEEYNNPFSDVLKLGFTKNITPRALKTTIEKEPGKFEYKSANTQLLGLIVERATGKKLQDYMKEKLWTPLGMEHDATWNIDSRRKNTVRAFCCINAAARDYAKFGRLFLNKGNWNGQQLVSENWINSSVSADTMKRYDGYKNQWWAGTTSKMFTDSLQAVEFKKATPTARSLRGFDNKVTGARNFSVAYYNGTFHANGILQQLLYVNPNNNLVIVRLGYYWQHPNMGAQAFIYNLGERLSK